MTFTFAAPEDDSLPLHVIDSAGLKTWRETLPEPQRAWVEAAGFRAKLGETLALPGPDGRPAGAVLGHGDGKARARARFGALKGVAGLPEAAYHLATVLPEEDRDELALGWLLSAYRFERYRVGSTRALPRLKAPEGADAARLESIATAEALTRDLINTPAADMGPDDLEAAVTALAREFDADLIVTRDDELLTGNLPLIHAVGRASPRAPRLLDMTWGSEGPRLTLVGKGVCFDTGGLNIKPGSSMGLMKKDMGGAATQIGLARMIMAAGWKVRLRLLIPAVENAIDGNAFRPGDILTSRKGLTVEVNNTDAEGRLVLADALALADEEAPDAIICMATLTGAARVAMGPELAPFFCDDDTLAAVLSQGGQKVRDPVWRMPFWDPYEAMIEPGIADLDNAPSGGQGGAITAALFLRRFVEATERFAHFDIYGWQPKDAPARPRGGLGQGARALFEALPSVLALDEA
ncbi:leucyl aminopeptidase family protein [Alkalilacustris brevis]|uniref:leucyl aminopeptidase family protein n=1 Tax=Alkalilacustris brevis TaxID=2026338 RepID=UPI000E0D4F80|nr:leucyl aminopeptidase family protein [Alkalilacustris brevis]